MLVTTPVVDMLMSHDCVPLNVIVAPGVTVPSVKKEAKIPAGSSSEACVVKDMMYVGFGVGAATTVDSQ